MPNLIGKPFQFGGRGVPGYDCYGLLLEVGPTYGWTLPDFVYSKEETGAMMVANMYDLVDKVEAKDMKPGDIVLFDDVSGYCGRHIGVMEDQFTFIHAMQGFGVCRSRISDLRFKNNLRGFYRVK